MQVDNPFDRKIELLRGAPPYVKDALIFVNDTLDVCLASAQSVFEKNATPELALAIYDRVVARMEVARAQALRDVTAADDDD